MFILLHVHEIPPVEMVQVVVPGHTPRLQLSHLVECFLGVIERVCHGLDVRPDVVWCAADELALECQPVYRDWAVCLLRVLVLLHDDVRRSEPSDFHQIRLAGISPEEDLLAQMEFRVDALILEAQACGLHLRPAVPSWRHVSWSGSLRSPGVLQDELLQDDRIADHRPCEVDVRGPTVKD